MDSAATGAASRTVERTVVGAEPFSGAAPLQAGQVKKRFVDAIQFDRRRVCG